MKIAVPREIREGERRVALVPESVKRLVTAGVEVALEAGAGDGAFFVDAAYQGAGATIEEDVAALLGGADFVLKVRPPTDHPSAGRHEVELMREGALLLCSLLPTRELEVVRALAERKISALATDAIPRTTRARSMDTLSSMANIAGYKAVLIAADTLPKYFPMFMTAAGTVFAAKVFVIGVDVAGLQAIATARRLGGTVVATDTRPEAAEQVQSLGAKFVGVESREGGGRAKELSQELYDRQARLIAAQCAASDVVITASLSADLRAPKLISDEMVRSMQPGSVIVDLAAPAGGNCELTEPGQTVVRHEVTICAPLNLPSQMPLHASTLFSRNLTAFVLEFWQDNQFNLDLEDELIAGALITHEGRVRHDGARKALESGEGQI